MLIGACHPMLCPMHVFRCGHLDSCWWPGCQSAATRQHQTNRSSRRYTSHATRCGARSERSAWRYRTPDVCSDAGRPFPFVYNFPQKKNNQKLANRRQDTPTFRKIELNNLLELFGMSYHPVYHVTNMKPTSGNCPRSTSRPPLVRWLALSPDRAEPRSIAGHAFECASAHALHATESAMVAMLIVQVRHGPDRTGPGYSDFGGVLGGLYLCFRKPRHG